MVLPRLERRSRRRGSAHSRARPDRDLRVQSSRWVRGCNAWDAADGPSSPNGSGSGVCDRHPHGGFDERWPVRMCLAHPPRGLGADPCGADRRRRSCCCGRIRAGRRRHLRESLGLHDGDAPLRRRAPAAAHGRSTPGCHHQAARGQRGNGGRRHSGRRGVLYIGDGSRIDVLGASGAQLRSVPVPWQRAAGSFAVDPAGSLYVDRSGQELVKLNASGAAAWSAPHRRHDRRHLRPPSRRHVGGRGCARPRCRAPLHGTPAATSRAGR